MFIIVRFAMAISRGGTGRTGRQAHRACLPVLPPVLAGSPVIADCAKIEQ